MPKNRIAVVAGILVLLMPCLDSGSSDILLESVGLRPDLTELFLLLLVLIIHLLTHYI
jgi:hypothetical protein